MAWTRVVALIAATAHPLRSLAVHFWLVLLDHVSSQGVPRLEDLVALSALVDNTGNVGLNVLLHLRGENGCYRCYVKVIAITVYWSLLE